LVGSLLFIIYIESGLKCCLGRLQNESGWNLGGDHSESPEIPPKIAQK